MHLSLRYQLNLIRDHILRTEMLVLDPLLNHARDVLNQTHDLPQRKRLQITLNAAEKSLASVWQLFPQFSWTLSARVRRKMLPAKMILRDLMGQPTIVEGAGLWSAMRL